IVWLLGYGVEVQQAIFREESAQPLGGGDGEDLPSNWKGAVFGTDFDLGNICKPCSRGVSIQLVQKLMDWTAMEPTNRGPLAPLPVTPPRPATNARFLPPLRGEDRPGPGATHPLHP